MSRRHRIQPVDFNRHETALEYLVNHLETIGLDRKDISWVIKEPRIYVPGKLEQEVACDAVVGYDGYKDVDLIELKHSYKHMEKAQQQLENTEAMFVNKIGYKVNNKYIVFYPFMNYKVLPKKEFTE